MNRNTFHRAVRNVAFVSFSALFAFHSTSVVAETPYNMAFASDALSDSSFEFRNQGFSVSHKVAESTEARLSLHAAIQQNLPIVDAEVHSAVFNDSPLVGSEERVDKKSQALADQAVCLGLFVGF